MLNRGTSVFQLLFSVSLTSSLLGCLPGLIGGSASVTEESSTSSSEELSSSVASFLSSIAVKSTHKIDIPVDHDGKVGVGIHAFRGSTSADGNKWVFTTGDGAVSTPAGLPQYTAILAERGVDGEVTYSQVVKSALGTSPSWTYDVLISPDGNWLALQLADFTDADPTDTNGQTDVYFMNLTTGALTRSVVPIIGGGYGYGEPTICSFSPDGTKLLFVSGQDLIESNGNRRDLYTYQISNGALALVSSNDSGATLTGGTGGIPGCGSYSANGNRVLFASNFVVNDSAGAVKVGLNDTNGLTDLYVKDLVTGDLELVSRRDTGALITTGGGVYAGSISADGKMVAFSSSATNVVAGDTNAVVDTFVYVIDTVTEPTPDLVAGTVFRVQNGATQPNGRSYVNNAGAWSATGHKLLLFSEASNWGVTDTNSACDLFVKDFDADTVEMVTIQQGVQFGHSIAVGVNGFFGRTSNEVWWVTDKATAEKVLPFAHGTTVLTKNLTSGDVAPAAAITVSGTPNGLVSLPEISSDQARFYFVSTADNLIANDTNRSADLFEYDFETETLTTVFNQADGTVAPLLYCLIPGTSKVVFSTERSGLVPGTSAGTHVYIKDMDTQAISLVSTDATEAVASSGGNANFPFCSPDGNKVAFTTTADMLQGLDTNGVVDLYVKTLSTGAIQRVTEADPARVTFFSLPSNQLASGFASAAVLALNAWDINGVFSTDSNEVLFMSVNNADLADSNAGNGAVFDDADSDADADVFVKNLSTGAVARVNSNAAGIPLVGGGWTAFNSFEPGSGRKVMFRTLVAVDAGDINNEPDLYVKDLDTGALEWASGINGYTNWNRVNFGISFGSAVDRVFSAVNGWLVYGVGPTGDSFNVRDPDNVSFPSVAALGGAPIVVKASRSADTDFAFIVGKDASEVTALSALYLYRVK